MILTPGTNGTLKSTTLEGAIIELAVFLNNSELNTTINTASANNISPSFSLDNSAFLTSFNIPATQTVNSDGTVKISATEYLTGTGYVPGTGGTLESTTPVAAFLELVTLATDAQADPTHNSSGITNITSSYDTNNAVFTGSITLPIAASLDSSGHALFTSTGYLT
jgi:hypothetical protein